MLTLLIFLTGIFISFWCSGLLYALHSSRLLKFQHFTENVNFKPQTYRISTKYNIPRTNCYDVPVRCPSDEEGVDCNCVSQCGVGFGEVTVLANSQTVFNEQLLEPGRYCLPKETVSCDKDLGYLIFSNGKFICQCKHPDIFGGLLCNERRNCFRGILRHAKTNVPLDAYNLPTENDYSCSCDVEDEDGNTMINLPGNPLECYKDPCKVWLRGRNEDDGVGFNTETGNCSCGDFAKTRVKNKFLDDPKSPCTSCYIDSNENQSTLLFRCASKNSSLNLATPCRRFDLISECERVSINLKFSDFKTFQTTQGYPRLKVDYKG